MARLGAVCALVAALCGWGGCEKGKPTPGLDSRGELARGCVVLDLLLLVLYWWPELADPVFPAKYARGGWQRKRRSQTDLGTLGLNRRGHFFRAILGSTIGEYVEDRRVGFASKQVLLG